MSSPSGWSSRPRTKVWIWVGPDGVLTGLTKRVLEAGLEAEMTEHLGYDKHAVEGRDGGDYCNGTRPKTVRERGWSGAVGCPARSGLVL